MNSLLQSVLIMFFVALLLPVQGCRQKSTPVTTRSEKASSTLLFQNIKLPVYDTAQEQIDYAYSLATGSSEQKIAFQFIPEHFAHQKHVCARALLQLAYLELGPDYRQANEKICYLALHKYADIADRYSDYPAIRAKALWYMGWIYSSLLGKIHAGMDLFHQLARDYERALPKPENPTPRISFVYPETRQLTENNRHTSSWKALALLECIKLEPITENRKNALFQLLESEYDSRAAALGLLLLLKHNPADTQIIATALKFTQNRTVEPLFAADIRKVLRKVSNSVKPKG